MKTVFEVLQSGTSYLEQRGCPDARHSMQSLLTHVLHCDKTRLYLQWERPLDEESLASLRPLLQRRGRGEPLQHLLGSVEFFRRAFKSDARALIPRPETEELVEKALKRVSPKPGMRVLDMGTGSGIIGVTLALELAFCSPEVVLADISTEALGLALENAHALGAKVKTYRSDLFSAWSREQGEGTAILPPSPFDLAVANLPYIPDGEELQTEVLHDPPAALFGGTTGMEIIERFLKDALPHLAPGALVALEVGYQQGERTAAVMRSLGYEDVAVERDIDGVARFPMARAPRIAAVPVAAVPVAKEDGEEGPL